MLNKGARLDFQKRWTIQSLRDCSERSRYTGIQERALYALSCWDLASRQLEASARDLNEPGKQRNYR
jgi:hypothetical protein